jgi:nucleoside-diphosphate-sugar epimerase
MDVIFGFGQVGQALARELTGRGRKVRVVSRSGAGPLLAGVDHVVGDASRPAFCRAVCTGADVVYLCLNAPYDRWAEELAPLQEAVLAGAEAASSKLVVLENLYMYGPHDGPLTEALPHAATDAKGVTRSKMSDALLAAHRSGRVRLAIGRASDFFGPRVLASQLGERAFAPLVAGKPVHLIGALKPTDGSGISRRWRRARHARSSVSPDTSPASKRRSRGSPRCCSRSWRG